MTFSIIIPVYNAEKYLANCLDSILTQSYSDFEIILVNDGSPDNSQAIIDRYVQMYPGKITALRKENGGAADARNVGISHATGNYLVFVDADDYISTELLSELAASARNCPADIIRYAIQTVYEDGRQGELLYAPTMEGASGEEALETLIDHKQYFDAACFCAIRRAYWQENGFRFATGHTVEDFGLIPELIMKASRFSAIPHVGYFYVQSGNSVMRNPDYSKAVRRANDCLYHVLHLRDTALAVGLSSRVRSKFLSYIANAAIGNIANLKQPEKNTYLAQLRKERILDLLLDDTLKRKAKKLYLKVKYGAF